MAAASVAPDCSHAAKVRFAGDQRLIDLARAGQLHTLGGHIGARSHQHGLAIVQITNRHVLGDQSGQLFPQRHRGKAECDGGAEHERHADRKRDQGHHGGLSILDLADGAAQKRRAAVVKQRRAEDRRNPFRPRERRWREPQRIRKHAPSDRRRDGQRKRNPELVAEHRDRVAIMFVVAFVFVMA